MRRLNGTETCDHFFAGDAELAGEAAGFVAAGDELALAAAAGLLAGFATSEEAGRKPRLPGLFSMFVAKLLMIFASESATSIKAAFKISLRWFVKVVVIRCRTVSPSGY